MRQLFERLIHCDWGVAERKRYLAEARREAGRWHVAEVRPVGASPAFVDELFDGTPTLAGFDFPIGLPKAYGAKTDLTGFREALEAFGRGRWANAFNVADDAHEVAIERPFYPRRSLKGTTHAALINGLGVERFDDLLRRCERRTDKRNAACSVFWTLGGNQVGKGAIAGWREVIKPGLARGAALWPFDGTLAMLADRHAVTLAETYPAAAYEASGIVFRRSESKRRQVDRAAKAGAILVHVERQGIDLHEDVRSMVVDGFGTSSSGEDAFDAFAGLLLMIEVVEGRRGEAPTQGDAADTWEGWIMGV